MRLGADTHTQKLFLFLSRSSRKVLFCDCCFYLLHSSENSKMWLATRPRGSALLISFICLTLICDKFCVPVHLWTLLFVLILVGPFLSCTYAAALDLFFCASSHLSALVIISSILNNCQALDKYIQA